MVERVVVLAGGLSPEREVSQRSGQRLASALTEAGLDVVVRDIGPELLGFLATDAPDAVFPVLHGSAGEDGTVQEILEMAGVAYVGATPEAARLTFDKPVAKALLARAGLRVPASVTLPRQAFHDLGAIDLARRLVDQLGLPLGVKPRSGGSAFGVTAVRSAADLPAALIGCFGYHEYALIEEWIEGTEVAVGVLDLAGPQALPAVEIVPDSGVYDYQARYTAGATQFFCPARLTRTVASAVAEAAVTAHRALGLRDLSRTDIIIDADERVVVLETAVAPGFTDTSTYPMALRAAGHDLGATGRDLAARAAARAG